MELKLTNEELEAIKYYRNEAYEGINQLLNSDGRIDIAKICDENEEVKINYNKIIVVNYIDTIKKIYSAILKSYLSKGRKEDWIFYKKCSINDIERFKNEPYIDGFMLATNNKEQNEDTISINQAIINIYGDKNVPYIMLKNVLDETNQEVLISPFTKVKEISDCSEVENEDRNIRTYNLKLECQELQEMSDDDKIVLYNYITTNSDLINDTISNTVNLEKENVSNYESIRELEKKISDLEIVINQKEQNNDYYESERNADNSDLQELNDRLEILKDRSTDIFNNIKNTLSFLVYFMFILF